jgi:drug/metabolite transporter (DMT)-like permease
MYFPIIGSIALASGTILEKVVLKKKKMDFKTYNAASFLGITILMIPLLFFFWKITPEALQLKNLLVLFGVLFFSLLANLFTYYSMKWEKVSSLEPAKITEPIFTIILTLIFSLFLGTALYERTPHALIPALIAGAALIFSHIKKHHLTFNKYFLAAIVGSFFYAVELVLSRLILDFYNPLTFYFIRCAAILIISLILFKHHFKKELDKKTSWLIILTSLIWIAYRVIVYFGYTHIGIISTTLILMLGPIFIYLFAWIFLKDKPTWRNIIASIIILACVIYASFL